MEKKWTTQKLILTAMLAAVAGVLMSLEFPLPMMPPFYKVDFSDVPSIIALFSMGPASGAAVEIIKILVKLFMKGTSTMYVGELANLIGVALFVLPIWAIYKAAGKNTKAAVISLSVSLPIRIALSCCINAFITLPLYAKAMGVSMADVIAIVGKVNPLITNLPLFLVLATVPFNLIKLVLNYVIGYAIFDRLKAVNVIKQNA